MQSLEKTVFGKTRFGVSSILWLGLIVFLCLIMVAEFKWDIMEQWAGSYLEWHNDQRPRVGTAWESFDQTVHAVEKVDTLASKLRARGSEVNQIKNLTSVPTLLSPRGGIPLSKEQFLRLFNGIPSYLSRDWIPTENLIKMTQQPEWERCYLWWDGESLDLYFVDQHNGVLFRKSIPGDWLQIVGQNGQSQPGILEEIGDFEQRNYPADRLWQNLDALSNDVVDQIFASRGLQTGEPLHRIGLSSYVVEGLGVIGLEFPAANGFMVEKVVIRDDDLWNLGTVLDRGGKPSSSEPF